MEIKKTDLELLADSPDGKMRKCASLGYLQGLKEAIAAGADPKKDGSDVLALAAVTGHADCVKYLIPLTDPLADDSIALTRAAEYGHVECIKLLIPVSHPRAKNSQAIKSAVAYAEFESVELLIPFSDLKSENSFVLRAAACYREKKLIQKLLPLSDLQAALSKLLELNDIDTHDFLQSVVQEAALREKTKNDSGQIGKKRKSL